MYPEKAGCWQRQKPAAVFYVGRSFRRAGASVEVRVAEHCRRKQATTRRGTWSLVASLSGFRSENEARHYEAVLKCACSAPFAAACAADARQKAVHWVRDFLLVTTDGNGGSSTAIDAVRERVRLLKGIAGQTIGCELEETFY